MVLCKITVQKWRGGGSLIRNKLVAEKNLRLKVTGESLMVGYLCKSESDWHNTIKIILNFVHFPSKGTSTNTVSIPTYSYLRNKFSCSTSVPSNVINILRTRFNTGHIFCGSPISENDYMTLYELMEEWYGFASTFRHITKTNQKASWRIWFLLFSFLWIFNIFC